MVSRGTIMRSPGAGSLQEVLHKKVIRAKLECTFYTVFLFGRNVIQGKGMTKNL